MKRLFVIALVLCFALFTTPAIQAQVAPQVVVGWDAVPASAGATGYNVYRSTTSGTFSTKLNTALITALTYTDTTVVRGTTYFYVVRAVNATGESPNSNQITHTVPQVVPPAPANLRVISSQ